MKANGTDEKGFSSQVPLDGHLKNEHVILEVLRDITFLMQTGPFSIVPDGHGALLLLTKTIELLLSSA